MTARQLCNYAYAVRAEGCEDADDLAEFDGWLYSPLDPRKAAAEKAFIRELRGGM
jgi:hypothetical protein